MKVITATFSFLATTMSAKSVDAFVLQPPGMTSTNHYNNHLGGNGMEQNHIVHMMRLFTRMEQGGSEEAPTKVSMKLFDQIKGSLALSPDEIKFNLFSISVTAHPCIGWVT